VTSTQTPFRQRLIAESVRLHEDRLGRILDDPTAEARAREATGDFEQRILRRAEELALGRRLNETLEAVRPVRRGLLLAALLLALLAGITTSAAVFGQQNTVNIGWALSALLGLQLLMLLLWLVFMLYRPGSGTATTGTGTGTGGGLLGRALIGGFERLGRRWSRRPESALVIAAGAGLLRREALGRWVASSLTHGLWTAFCIGALVATVFALSVRQYDFVWGTTLLTEDSFVALMALLGTPAQWLGWPVPDEAVVRASRIGVEETRGRALWSGLLLSSLLFYGLLPRLLLTLLSIALARRGARRLRLDTSLPGYARLSERLGSHARSIGVLDPRPADLQTAAPEAPRGRPDPVTGAVLLIGMELERGSEGWPPRLPGVAWSTLGRADDRTQRQDVLAALRARVEPPGVVLVACSLARTPDRGAERFLAGVREQAAAPVWALLDEGHRLEARGIDRPGRVHHWQQAARRAGLEYVLEVNLDDPRHAGCRELVELVGSGEATA